MTPTEAAVVLTTHYRQHTKTCPACYGYVLDDEGDYNDCRRCGNTGRVAKTQNDYNDEQFTLAVQVFETTHSAAATRRAMLDAGYSRNVKDYARQAEELVNSRGA